MGIPILKGRGFTERDNDRAPEVLLISETFAAKYWPNDDPIGKTITIGYNKSGPREIIGIVGNVKRATLADAAAPQMYTPFEQTPWPFLAAVVRTTAAPESVASSVRAMLTRLDPLQGSGELRTLDQYVARSVATPRFTAMLVGAFAVFAVLLAGFGLFSVMAYSVAQRRREIGIRMALGAQASDVRGMVVSQAIRTAGIGLLVGLAGALAATRVLASLLYQISPNDPATFAGVSVVLLGVMLLAAYLPARRATRVDPITALRTE
jgi:putative ABC transport system permease protein